MKKTKEEQNAKLLKTLEAFILSLIHLQPLHPLHNRARTIIPRSPPEQLREERKELKKRIQKL
jgi:hypothetical protein